MDKLTAALPVELEPVITVGRMRLTALIIATALFMQNVDSSIMATALPAIAKSFRVPPLHMSVTLTSYLISLSVFIPASGWVADHFGSRQVFRAAIVIFTVASALCGLAPSLWLLVAARVLQGMGGAMMVPVGRLVLLRSVSKIQMISAMSWLTVPSLLGPVVGPPLGGFIVTYFSWHWVFDINIPIGIIGVTAVTLFIPDIREADRGGKLDAAGLVLTGFAMAALMAAFETIGRGLVPLSWTLLAFATGIVTSVTYTRHARRHPHPVLDFSLLAIPTYGRSVLAGSLFRVAIGALPFLLPMMLQIGFGKSPLQSGLVTFASGIGAIGMKPAAQPVIRHFGFRATMMINGALSSAFLMLCALFSPAWPSLLMSALLLVGGFFRSLQFTAFNTLAYSDIPRARMSAATSLYATIQQLTLTLGIVIGAAALEASVALHHHSSAAPSDFVIAFILVGLISALAVPVCATLAPTPAKASAGTRRRVEAGESTFRKQKAVVRESKTYYTRKASGSRARFRGSASNASGPRGALAACKLSVTSAIMMLLHWHCHPPRGACTWLIYQWIALRQSRFSRMPSPRCQTHPQRYGSNARHLPDPSPYRH